MSIKINCRLCNRGLKELGGLIFSPPDEEGRVYKYHICKKCFKSLQGTMDRMSELLYSMSEYNE